VEDHKRRLNQGRLFVVSLRVCKMVDSRMIRLSLWKHCLLTRNRHPPLAPVDGFVVPGSGAMSCMECLSGLSVIA
jgi:hypothetical protein